MRIGILLVLLALFASQRVIIAQETEYKRVMSCADNLRTLWLWQGEPLDADSLRVLNSIMGQEAFQGYYPADADGAQYPIWLGMEPLDTFTRVLVIDSLPVNGSRPRIEVLRHENSWYVFVLTGEDHHPCGAFLLTDDAETVRLLGVVIDLMGR